MERMDTAQWASRTVVIQRLLDHPYDFNFLQAVRLFQKLSLNGNLLGKTLTAQEDPVIFSGRYTYSLPSSDIYKIYFSSKNIPVIEVNFLNLAGPHGPLPNPLSEKVIQGLNDGNNALKDFIDIFNHRLLSIYYRIAEKYSFVLSPKSVVQTLTGRMVTSIGGLLSIKDMDAYPNISSNIFFQYASILWQRPRSAAGLEQLLSDYFQVPIFIEQFSGSWTDIDRRQRSFMGNRKGRNNKLGKTTFLGKRFWQSAHHFIVHIGPLTKNEFHRLIPTGSDYLEMCDIIKLYAPLQLTFQLKLSLKQGEILDGAGFDPSSVTENALGWTAVLKTSPSSYHVTVSAA